MSLRAIIAMYFGYPLWHAFLHALTASTFIVFAINSAIWCLKNFYMLSLHQLSLYSLSIQRYGA